MLLVASRWVKAAIAKRQARQDQARLGTDAKL
jgi:hypothetical protein